MLKALPPTGDGRVESHASQRDFYELDLTEHRNLFLALNKRATRDLAEASQKESAVYEKWVYFDSQAGEVVIFEQEPDEDACAGLTLVAKYKAIFDRNREKMTLFGWKLDPENNYRSTLFQCHFSSDLEGNVTDVSLFGPKNYALMSSSEDNPGILFDSYRQGTDQLEITTQLNIVMEQLPLVLQELESLITGT